MLMMRPTKTQVWNEEVRVELDLLWRTMETVKVTRVNAAAAKARNGRSMYARLEEELGVPWWFVACVHGLEASFDFTRHLHNGDRLSARTRLVPAGRPRTGNPPFTWMDSARDALTMPGKAFDRVQDWSIPHALWLLEGFNGRGYRLYRAIHSPYLWAGTNHYSRGKYVADGRYSAKAVSQQIGAAALMKAIL